MKIGIDVRTLETGHRFRGIGAYSADLLRAIAKIDKINQYILFCQKKPSNAMKLIDNPNFSDFQIDNYADFENYHYLADQKNLPKAIKNSNVQLVHFLDQLSCPLIKKVKTVVTVHDLIQLTNFSDNKMKNRIKFYPVKRADKIIVISEDVKSDLIEYMNIKEEKIKVIYNGYNQDKFIVNHDEEELAIFRKKILQGKGEKYLLYAASFGQSEPRKNFDFLIEVFEKYLKKSNDRSLILLMVGKLGKESDRLKQISRDKKIDNNIIFTDYVKHDDLPIYYQAAEGFLFPSLYEGFGLPPLEAMACGCPVISSNLTSLPEVIGDGGILLDPTDSQSWVASIEKILKYDYDRESLISKGLAQAKKFSWSKTAKEVIQTYQEIINEN